MATHLTRGELKRNELGEAVEASVHFAEHHLRAILYGAAGLLAAGLLVWGAVAWHGSRAESANAALGEALRIASAPVTATGARPDDPAAPSFATEADRDRKARERFEKVVAEHGGTDAGAAARLWLADRAFAGGDRATAQKLWREFLDQAPGGLLAAVAQRNLWTIGRAEGRGEEVLAEVRKALERSAGDLPADALLWELAETHRTLGHADDERAALRRIVDEHPDSPFAGSARQRLAEVGAAS
ncbi:MAG TPA: tetratricopeptide repeat protein [Thermoanaerobaculia bacterium]|nr:tetratricopeptide repeat protein [Thermoanaerobaculia bacterium]